MSIYDYTIKSGKGEDVALSDYKGKVMMIVNTATGATSSQARRLRQTRRSTSSARLSTTHSSPR